MQCFLSTECFIRVLKVFTINRFQIILFLENWSSKEMDCLEMNSNFLCHLGLSQKLTFSVWVHAANEKYARKVLCHEIISANCGCTLNNDRWRNPVNETHKIICFGRRILTLHSVCSIRMLSQTVSIVIHSRMIESKHRDQEKIPIR